jgi:hypothetical protein
VRESGLAFERGQTLQVRRVRDSAFSDYCAYQFGRGYVESGIEYFDAPGCDLLAAEMSYFAGGSLFYRNFGAAWTIEIDR